MDIFQISEERERDEQLGIGDDLDFQVRVVSLDEEKLIVETGGSGSRINLAMSGVSSSLGF